MRSQDIYMIVVSKQIPQKIEYAYFCIRAMLHGLRSMPNGHLLVLGANRDIPG